MIPISSSSPLSERLNVVWANVICTDKALRITRIELILLEIENEKEKNQKQKQLKLINLVTNCIQFVYKTMK